VTVLTLEGALSGDITAFRYPELFDRVGLPDQLWSQLACVLSRHRNHFRLGQLVVASDGLWTVVLVGDRRLALTLADLLSI